MMLLVALTIVELVEPSGVDGRMNREPLGTGYGLIARLVGFVIGIALFVLVSQFRK
jgi:hypothetical protein